MAKNISVTIKFWKQNGPKDKGHFDTHELKNIPDDTSFLEALDIMNEELINEGKEPFVFDHDCREGICGMCSLYINGTPHGKTERGATTCQLYMRKFKDGETITVEPWRSAGFPVIKDCMVDRNAFDKIMQAGGYTTVRTGRCRRGYGLRQLHRLRCLRGSLQERLCNALRQLEGEPACSASSG